MIFRHHLGNFSGDKHQGPAVLPIGEVRRHRLRHVFFTSLTDASLKVGGRSEYCDISLASERWPLNSCSRAKNRHCGTNRRKEWRLSA